MDPKTRALVTMAVIGLVAGYLASIIVGPSRWRSRWIHRLRCRPAPSSAATCSMPWASISASGTSSASQIVTATVGAIIVVILARIIA